MPVGNYCHLFFFFFNSVRREERARLLLKNADSVILVHFLLLYII